MIGEFAYIADTETTELIHTHLLPIHKQPHIIEFYGMIIDLDTGEVQEELELLIKPPCKITKEITKITGIDDDMVKDAKPFAEVSDVILNSIRTAPCFIAHNASFDKEMIDIEFERLQVPVPWPRVICTVEQTVHLLGYRLTLQNLHQHLFGEKFKEAHRARNDVQALGRCCVELRRRGQL